MKADLIKNMTSGNYRVLYRTNGGGMRWYFDIDPFVHYSGLTGAMEKSTFKGDQDARRLDSWRSGFIDSFGEKAQKDYVEMTAEFGTLLHMALVTIKEKGKLVWLEEKDKARYYFEDIFLAQGRPIDERLISKMVFEYCKHAASLLQFIHERVSEIHAIEVPAICERLKIATPIDLVCTARPTPKADFVKMCVNLKTSSSITAHHLEQSAMEAMMWGETYNDMAVPAILRTKDFRGNAPTYDFKVSEADVSDLMERMSLCLKGKSSYWYEPTFEEFMGETSLGEPVNIRSISLEEKMKGLI